ncbi:MAG: NACHT domain-containing protein [Anaerolineales bacterium]|nr:NACHT domain-containing protein [Anaerolineales bacterium]
MAVQLSNELNSWKTTPKPWPSFLPTQFSLQSQLRDAKTNHQFILCDAVNNWLNGETDGLWPGADWQRAPLRAVVGLIDYPSEARQDPLAFELGRYHLAVYGDAGSGKTTLLRTLVTSLAATHSPDELHIYVLDLGGRGFRVLEGLPHIGTVIYADEETYYERLGRLVDKLNRIAEERQKFLSDAGVNSLYEYNAAHPQEPYPAVLVVIDNFPELWENQEQLVENVLVPLIRRSLAMGITFVVATASLMVSRVTSLFGERVTFRQANTDRYMDLVGRGAIEFGNVPGRGYMRVDQRPLLFHAARPTGVVDADATVDASNEASDLQRLAEHMCLHIRTKLTMRTQPDPIRTLPEIVPLTTMLDMAAGAMSANMQAVLGENAALLPAIVDLKKMGPHFVVAGPPFSGKTTVLLNWVLSLGYRYPPSQVAMLLIDVQRRLADYGGRHRLDELPHVLSVLDEVEQLEALLPQLKAECEGLAGAVNRREIYVIIDNYDDFAEDLEKKRNLAQELPYLARRYGRDGLRFVIAGNLEGGGNELRRRIQSGNFGLGLRTGQALDALRVSRRPAGMQDKELNVGRGYLVKSGQTALVQVASPYEINGGTETEDNDIKVAQALDYWVERIVKRYPDEHLEWQAAPQNATSSGVGAATADPRAAKLLDLLHRAAYKRAAEGEQVRSGAVERYECAISVCNRRA